MVKTAKEIVKQKLEKAISSYNKYSNDENKKGNLAYSQYEINCYNTILEELEYLEKRYNIQEETIKNLYDEIDELNSNYRLLATERSRLVTENEKLKNQKNNETIIRLSNKYDVLNILSNLYIQENENLKDIINMLVNKAGLHLHHLKYSKNYSLWWKGGFCYLTRKEYELLKEMLEND